MNRLRAWLAQPAASRPVLLLALVALGAAALAAGVVATDGEDRSTPPQSQVTIEPASPIIAPSADDREASASTGDAARPAASAFLTSYLAYLYGQAGTERVAPVSPAVRRELVAARLRVPPAQRQRRPRVVDLRLTRQAATAVLATATVDDGDVAVYRIVFTLDRAEGGRWRVSRLAND